MIVAQECANCSFAVPLIVAKALHPPPLVCVQSDTDADGPLLPQKADEESKGFQRKVLEFTFWCVPAQPPLLALLLPPSTHMQARSPAHPLLLRVSLPTPIPRRYNATKAVLIAFCMTFVGLFDFPVFWPILLLYFLALFALTMRQQIANMIKYKYVPFTWGKARYDRARGKGKDAAPVAVPPAEPLFRGANLR